MPCEKTDETVKPSQNKWPTIYLSLPKSYIEQQNEQPNSLTRHTLNRPKLTSSVDGHRRGPWYEELQMQSKSYTNAVLSSLCKGQVLNRTVLLFQKPAISPGESNQVLLQKLTIKLTFHCGSSTILKQDKERRELSVSSLSFSPENSQVARRVKYVFVK